MDQNNNFPHDPWEQDSYQTGRTRPPKSRGGLIAVLLLAVIFLGGVSSVLGIMNIKLFHRLNNQESNGGMAFHEGTQPQSGETNPSSPTEASHPNSDVTVDLNKTPESVDNIPQAGGLSYQAIYDKAIPSVVSVSCNTGTGTGVVLSANGYIVTNCHVVAGATNINILLSDQRTFPAVVVGADAVSDLAVLYVKAEDLTPAEFGDSSALRVGDAVAAIGDPLGLEYRGTMTDGIVSAINRDVTTNGRTMTLIQTNAALNSGNSGGPLLNCYGQVIGINTMKIGAFSDAAGVEGLGFAIPSTTVKEIVDQLIAQGYVSGRPSLGFAGETVTELEQRFYHLPAGVLVTEVVSGSSADQAGIDPGDILLRIGDTRISNVEQLEEALYAHQPGDNVDLLLYRSGWQYGVNITLDEAEG